MTRMTTLTMLAVGLIATALTSAQRGEDTISLGSLELALGTSEQAIRAKLPKDYTLELNEPSPGSAVVTGLVFSKPGRLSENMLGQVEFQEGKLSSVSRDSGIGSREDSVPFARTLYSLVYSLTENQERSCLISTSRKSLKNAQIEGMTINCGKRNVQVFIAHPDAGEPSAEIFEGLGRR